MISPQSDGKQLTRHIGEDQYLDNCRFRGSIPGWYSAASITLTLTWIPACAGMTMCIKNHSGETRNLCVD